AASYRRPTIGRCRAGDHTLRASCQADSHLGLQSQCGWIIGHNPPLQLPRPEEQDGKCWIAKTGHGGQGSWQQSGVVLLLSPHRFAVGCR
ncbi:hypothetical protein LINGRAPRIM_LOCUS2267, partial [Linum grandiflorum]